MVVLLLPVGGHIHVYKHRAPVPLLPFWWCSWNKKKAFTVIIYDEKCLPYLSQFTGMFASKASTPCSPLVISWSCNAFSIVLVTTDSIYGSKCHEITSESLSSWISARCATYICNEIPNFKILLLRIPDLHWQILALSSHTLLIISLGLISLSSAELQPS